MSDSPAIFASDTIRTPSQRLLAEIEQPRRPYRGVLPFRLLDQHIFTGRATERKQVLQLVCIYKGVLLYGDSGSGKSSLVNAAVIPDLIAEGFEVERLRVQPVEGEEIVIERIPISEESESEALPSIFAKERSLAHQRRTTSSSDVISALEAHRSRSGGVVRVLIFDQFEELVTQFEDAQTDRAAFNAAQRVQQQIISLLHRLLSHPGLGVKLLFVFRDDYFGRLAEKFPAFPQIKDQSLRLTSPSVQSLPDIIQKPFTAVSFERQLSSRTQNHLVKGFHALSTNGLVNLTEVQIACSSVWDNKEAEIEFLEISDARSAVQCIFDGYVPSTLAGLPKELKPVCIAALCRLVTPATATAGGTRNIVSEYNLISGLENEDGYSRDLIERGLDSLCDRARLVFRHIRGATPFYEIVSEFLVRSIAAQQSGVERAREMRKAKLLESEVARQTENLRKSLRVLMVAGIGLLLLAYYAYSQYARAMKAKEAAEFSAKMAETERQAAEAKRDEANRANPVAMSEAERSKEQLLQTSDDLRKLRQSFEGELQVLTRKLASNTATVADVEKIIDTNQDPLVDRLSGAKESVSICEYSPDGRFIATGSADKRIRVWSRLGGKLLGEAVASSSTGGVTTLAFSPDSSILLSGSTGSTLRVFDPRLADLGLGKEINAHSDTITHVEFSHDGKLSVSCSADRTVVLLDWSQYPKVIPSQPLNNDRWRHNKTVTFATFSADDSRVVTSGDDSTARVFNTSGEYVLVPVSYGRSPINPLDVDPGSTSGTPVRGMRFNPADSDLVVGGAGNRKVVWFSLNGERMALYRDDSKSGPFYHEGAVLDVAFRPSGTHVATVATDGLCLVWDVPSAKTVASVPTEIQGRLFDVDWRKDDLLALVGEDGWLELWDMTIPTAPRPVFSVQAHKGVARGVRFDPLDKQVLTWSGYQDGYTNVGLSYLPDAKGKAATLKFPDKTRLADNTAALWDIEAAKIKGWTKR